MGTGTGLAWAGVRHRPGPWLLLALGLALAAVMPLAAAGLQERAAVGAVQQAVAAVPDPARGVLAVTSRDLRGSELASVSDQVTSGLERAGLPRPTRALAYRTLSLQGTDATVAALDRLADDVALTSGRLPTTCSPTACEVLVVTSSRAADPTVPDLAAPARSLGLVVTGSATLREPRLVGLGLVAPGQPLLIGSDPAALADLTALTVYGRNLAWFAPLDAAVVTGQGPGAFAAALDQVATDVNLVAGPLNVVWPDGVVLDAAARAQGSAGRFAVLGVGAGSLQLGFCLVLAAARRPAQRQHGTLLGRRGARPRQVLGVAALQASLAVGVGLVVGTAAGLAVVATLARGLPDPWAGALAALATAWPVVISLGVAAVLGSVLLAAGPALGPGTVRGVVGAVVLLAGALAALALVRPTADPRAPLPVAALVGLTLAAGLVGALLWSPVVMVLGRPGRSVGGRAALRRIILLTGRRPLLPSVTAGFLAAALATAFLAGAWSASTAQSAQDQAATLVPLDARVSPSTQVQLPATVVDAAGLTAIAPDVVVAPVTSTVVSAFAGSTGATGLPLTGLDPDVLPLVHRWSAVTGSDRSAADVADALRTPTGASPAPVIPAGTRRLVLDVRGLDADVTLGVWVAGPDGQERQVRLAQRGDQAYADLEAGPALAVRAVEIGESADHLTYRQHGIGEGSTDRELPSGTLRFGAVRADSAVVPWPWTGWGADSVTVRTEGSDGWGLQARYQIRDARAVLLPSWVPVARRPVLPVAVDAVTAARAGARGTFGITLNQTTQPVRVVAVLPRMPTLPSRFVIADRSAVAALVDRTAPGTGPVLQLWVSAPGASAPAVRDELTATASAATLTYRDELARGFAQDPVTTGFVALLAAAGLVAFLLGLVAVVGGVRGDREQAGADLFALEVDGVGPAALRRVLLSRAALVLVVGLPVGLLAGSGLAAAATRLLATGPDGRPLSPPPHLVLASAPTALVLVAAVVGTVLAAALTASASLREPQLAAPELELR